jgi:signal-transduction protein with cAMP-binding, CBS, and nucleotidyltransferase domain
MHASDTVEYLYFVHLGSVNVFDRHNRFLTQYVAGSNLGDFQIILGLKAGYTYVGSASRTNYLFQVKKEAFLKSLFSDYDAMVYLSKIALQRRKHLKRQELKQKVLAKFRGENNSNDFDSYH